jgi:hypothetical protein
MKTYSEMKKHAVDTDRGTLREVHKPIAPMTPYEKAEKETNASICPHCHSVMTRKIEGKENMRGCSKCGYTWDDNGPVGTYPIGFHAPKSYASVKNAGPGMSQKQKYNAMRSMLNGEWRKLRKLGIEITYSNWELKGTSKDGKPFTIGIKGYGTASNGEYVMALSLSYDGKYYAGWGHQEMSRPTDPTETPHVIENKSYGSYNEGIKLITGGEGTGGGEPWSGGGAMSGGRASPIMGSYASKKKAMWKMHLQEVYNNFEEFKSYDSVYGNVKTLGFASAEEAWEANPLVQGSTNPRDYKVVGTYASEKKSTLFNDLEPGPALVVRDCGRLSAGDKVNVESVCGSSIMGCRVVTVTTSLGERIEDVDAECLTQQKSRLSMKAGDKMNKRSYVEMKEAVKKTATVWLGRTDGKGIPVPTEAAAQEILAVIEKYDAEGVARGEYYIDVNEDELNAHHAAVKKTAEPVVPNNAEPAKALKMPLEQAVDRVLAYEEQESDGVSPIRISDLVRHVMTMCGCEDWKTVSDAVRAGLKRRNWSGPTNMSR